MTKKTMRIVCNMRGPDAAIAYLGERLPEIEILATDGPEAVARALPGARALIISNRVYTPDMAEAVLCHGGDLRLIQFTTSGIDKALKSGGFPAGVQVANTAGLRAINLAEHAFMLLLALARRLRETEAARTGKTWIRDQISREMTLLDGRTLCIIGMGATGQAVARRAAAFGMRVIGVSRAFAAGGPVARVYPRERLHEALAEADAILLSLPSEPETRSLIDGKALAVMKPEALLINIARGDLIDEPALIKALTEGRLGGAGLDVTAREPTPADNPLWSLDQVILTPHVAAGGTPNPDTRLFDMLVENLQRLAEGRELLRLIPWESLMAEENGPTRPAAG